MKNDNLKGQHRINEQIRAKEVRIVGDDIESAVYPIAQALKKFHPMLFLPFVELLIILSFFTS